MWPFLSASLLASKSRLLRMELMIAPASALMRRGIGSASLISQTSSPDWGSLSPVTVYGRPSIQRAMRSLRISSWAMAQSTAAWASRRSSRMAKRRYYGVGDLDAPMPLTCAYLKSLHQPELFEFRPRLGALAKMVLCGRRPWWQMQERGHSAVQICGIGRLLLLLAPMHPRRLLEAARTARPPHRKTWLSRTDAQIRPSLDQT